MSEWREHLLGDVIAYAIGGGWGEEAPAPGLRAVQVVRGADFPEVEVGDVTNLPVRYETPKRFAARNLESGDIVLEISGGTKGRPTGRVVRITESLLADSSLPLIPASFCRLVRPDPDAVDPEFLYYLLLDWYKRGGSWAFQNQSTGIANFQFKMFMRNFGFLAPQLTEQRAIAEVLGALDDKIEANRKLATTADALTGSIFAEAAQDASLSEATYGELAKIGGGGTPKSKVDEFWSGDVRWLTPTDVTALPGPYVEETSRRISEAGLASISSPLYPVGSIAMTSRATIGSFAILDRPMAVNQGFIVVQPHDESLRLWLFHEMRRRVREFYDYANGATFMELSRGNFKKIRVHLSDYNTMSRFGERVRPLHDSARLALQENETLTDLRDTLLPKLMSGQLSVVEVAEMAGL